MECPERSAANARLFWHPRYDPSAITVHATPVTRAGPYAFDLFRQPVPATLLIPLCGDEQLLLGQGHRSIRLSIERGSLRDGPVTLTFRLDGMDAIDLKLQVLRRFAVFRRHGRIPSAQRTRFSGEERRLLIIRTLDALAIDPSHRAVAIALFGKRRVAAEWGTLSDSLQSTVRRLVARANALARGGYLDLLSQ